jgi:hypothetical protein
MIIGMPKNMNMENERTLFTETPHCQSKAHCSICRKKESGRPFRVSLSSTFRLPDDEIDFKCPFGIDWAEESSDKKNSMSVQDIRPKKGCSACSRAKKK